jgi:hypothetical protein
MISSFGYPFVLSELEFGFKKSNECAKRARTWKFK